MADSPELQELKKQTRMMAEKEASRAAAFLFILALFGAGWLGLTGWPLFAAAVGAAVVGWVGAMKVYAGN